MTRFRSVCAQGHLTKKEQHLRHYKIEKSKKVGKNFLMMKSRVEDHLKRYRLVYDSPKSALVGFGVLENGLVISCVLLITPV